MATRGVIVLDHGRALCFSFDEMVRYNGHRSPGGVAHAYKVLERCLPLLDGGAPIERWELVVATAFNGPGVRDGFELVTRAVLDGRFAVDPSLAHPSNGPVRGEFVFDLRYRNSQLTAVLRDGFVTNEFISLFGLQDRSRAQRARFEQLKHEMAKRVMGAPAELVYDVEVGG